MAVGCITFFVIEFRNEISTTLVDFKTFHKAENDIFPSLTLCIGPTKTGSRPNSGVWNKKKLNDTYGIESPTDYHQFLKGKTWDERMIHVDFDDVTLNLTDYLNYWSIWADKASLTNQYPNDGWVKKDFWSKMVGRDKKMYSTFIKEKNFRFFTSFRSAATKCFSLDLTRKSIPMTKGKEIKKLVVSFRNLSSLNSYFHYYLHYPGQFLVGNFLLDSEDPKHKNFPGMVKRTIFSIDGIEIITRRNTHNEQCKEESDRHDEYVLNELVKSVKCKPSLFTYDYDFEYQKICNNSDAMKKIYYRSLAINTLKFRSQFVKPCDQLQMVTYSRKDILKNQKQSSSSMVKQSGWRVLSEWTLELGFMRDVYKEIRHIRDYDKKSLLSDVSAIIGFICGFSIWQLPDALNILMISIKRKKTGPKN